MTSKRDLKTTTSSAPLPPGVRIWECDPIEDPGDAMKVTHQGRPYWWLYADVDGHVGHHFIPRQADAD